MSEEREMSEHMNIDEGNSSMSIAGDLNVILRDAADLIDRAGWVRGSMGDESSGYCEHGAIMACTPRRGDAYLVRAVMRRRGFDEVWNDQEGRTAGEVTGALRSVEVTDAELAGVFGPQWREVVSLVRRAAALTEAEVAELEYTDVAARHPARDAAWRASWNAARGAAGRAERAGSWNAAWDAAWCAAWRATGNAAGDAVGLAAGRAAWALVVRDLVGQYGQYGLTQEHYDVLTKPWASVIGKVHPDD